MDELQRITTGVMKVMAFRFTDMNINSEYQHVSFFHFYFIFYVTSIYQTVFFLLTLQYCH